MLGSSDLAALEAGSGTHFALYIIIPFVSAIVGYVTNVVALKMTFYPLEFTPAPLKFAQPKGQPFGLLGGWQGIIREGGEDGGHPVRPDDLEAAGR